jgi:multidrug resistance protein, MATE family
MTSHAASSPAHHAPLSLAGLRLELPKLLRLAGPVVIAELGGMAMGLVDVMMVGRVSAEAIGGVSVGANLFHFVAMFGIGILLGLDYLVSHAFGGGRVAETHRTLVQSLYLCVVLSAALMLLLWTAHRYLGALGIEAAVLPDARAYLASVTWGMLPFLWFVALRRYLQAVGLVRAATFALISANLVNAFVNWLLIFGNLGAPALGAAGAAWATTASRVYMLLVLIGFTIWHAGRYDRALFRVSLWPDVALLRRIVALGLPASVQVVLEGGVFTAATLLAAGLDPLSLAAHQIALGAAAFSFMVPLGVASAGAVRVGQALGAGDPRAAERAGWAALAIGAAFMSCAALVFTFAPRLVMRAFTDDQAVIATGISLLLVAAVFQLFDGLQVVAAGILRGSGETRIAMVAALIGYWAIGLPVGYALCFAGDMGVQGLWIGLSVGLIVVALALVAWWARRIASLQHATHGRQRLAS